MFVVPSFVILASYNHISSREEADEDDDDTELRTESLCIEGQSDDAPMVTIDISQYPFLNLKENNIIFNGDDWSDLRGRFSAIDDTIVSIVHIGDSHLQADVASARTRTLLQNHYGSSGRGLIVPLKLAHTNQPFDYAITSDCRLVTASLMRTPYPTTMGFTGVSIEPRSRRFSICISTKPNYGQTQDFDCIKVYGHGEMPMLKKATSVSTEVNFEQHLYRDTLTINLSDYVDHVDLDFSTKGKCNIFGFKLENSMMGVEYHVIGNNGARYDTYNKVGGIGRALRALSPDLVIISLGANEAYGHITDTAFYENIDIFVRDIRSGNPKAHIMLVTPGPCMKRYNGAYRDNLDIKRLRNVIMRYGYNNRIAVYDWYVIAGGAAGSHAMLEYGLLSKDHIHNTLDGYILQGELFYNALIQAIDDRNERD